MKSIMYGGLSISRGYQPFYCPIIECIVFIIDEDFTEDLLRYKIDNTKHERLSKQHAKKETACTKCHVIVFTDLNINL